MLIWLFTIWLFIFAIIWLILAVRGSILLLIVSKSSLHSQNSVKKCVIPSV